MPWHVKPGRSRANPWCCAARIRPPSRPRPRPWRVRAACSTPPPRPRPTNWPPQPGSHGHALALTAPDLDALAALAARLREAGFNDLLLDFAAGGPAERHQTSVIARRAALKDDFKPLGYPHLRFVTGDLLDAAAQAATEIAKYGSVCVLPDLDMALVSVLMTLRLNLYTDPQKPIQVEPKLYEIGEPGPESPVFVTTNFSLTYFLVSGEIENTGVSAWLAVPECEGMSVLTAWGRGQVQAADPWASSCAGPAWATASSGGASSFPAMRRPSAANWRSPCPIGRCW